MNDSPNRDCVSVDQTLLGKKCDNESEFFWNTYVGIRVNQDITYPLIVTNTLTWHQLHLANNVMAVSVLTSMRSLTDEDSALVIRCLR